MLRAPRRRKWWRRARMGSPSRTAKGHTSLTSARLTVRCASARSTLAPSAPSGPSAGRGTPIVQSARQSSKSTSRAEPSAGAAASALGCIDGASRGPAGGRGWCAGPPVGSPVSLASSRSTRSTRRSRVTKPTMRRPRPLSPGSTSGKPWWPQEARAMATERRGSVPRRQEGFLVITSRASRRLSAGWSSSACSRKAMCVASTCRS
mmetsp:Transcript_18552/g.54294  ORF Transcript_18552/g.54294 Transcript_18552/m.54294 type:complete len:206 (+) Transcript_18552:141-758(+)